MSAAGYAAGITPTDALQHMPEAVQALRNSIEAELRAAGVELDHERVAAIAEVILGDAVTLALGWLEPG